MSEQDERLVFAASPPNHPPAGQSRAVAVACGHDDDVNACAYADPMAPTTIFTGSDDSFIKARGRGGCCCAWAGVLCVVLVRSAPHAPCLGAQTRPLSSSLVPPPPPPLAPRSGTGACWTPAGVLDARACLWGTLRASPTWTARRAPGQGCSVGAGTLATTLTPPPPPPYPCRAMVATSFPTARTRASSCGTSGARALSSCTLAWAGSGACCLSSSARALPPSCLPRQARNHRHRHSPTHPPASAQSHAPRAHR